jgi:DNA-binding transcriptional MerR regulator
MALTVSALADQAGLSADTVRYYERVGLLPEPARSAAGYRLYDQTAVGRLRLIKGAQRAGLRLREIGELLQVADQGQCPCGHTETLLLQRLAEVRAERDRLRALEADLVGLLERQPDPACPDLTAGAPPGGAPRTIPTPASHHKGGDRHAAAGLHARLSLRRPPTRLLLDQPGPTGRDRQGATGLAASEPDPHLLHSHPQHDGPRLPTHGPHL